MVVLFFCISSQMHFAQQKLVQRPSMGFMTWSYFGLNNSENDIKTLTNASFTTQNQTLEDVEIKYGRNFYLTISPFTSYKKTLSYP